MKLITICSLLVVLLSFPVLAVEVETHVFNSIDMTRDGQITLDELFKSNVKVRKQAVNRFVVSSTPGKDADPKNAEKQKRELFQTMDTDRNGVVSRKEWVDSISNGIVLFRF
jgi:Ca2+-binding EF-hand superfamily protein